MGLLKDIWKGVLRQTGLSLPSTLPSEPPPEPEFEETLPEGTPVVSLGPLAASLIAPKAPTQATLQAPHPEPLTGSLQERLSRARLG